MGNEKRCPFILFIKYRGFSTNQVMSHEFAKSSSFHLVGNIGRMPGVEVRDVCLDCVMELFKIGMSYIHVKDSYSWELLI